VPDECGAPASRIAWRTRRSALRDPDFDQNKGASIPAEIKVAPAGIAFSAAWIALDELSDSPDANGSIGKSSVYWAMHQPKLPTPPGSKPSRTRMLVPYNA
jgi:hypothetical protein